MDIYYPAPFSNPIQSGLMATSGDHQLKLYSYFRSSCSFRVRIALNLKGLKYECKPVNLLKGEQFSPEFRKLNPIGYVPVLVDGDIAVSDSFAILMYLEEKYPQHPLLPKDLRRKAINFQAANIVSSSIQPHQNIGVLKYIDERVGSDAKTEWAKDHIGKGFAALEDLLKNYAGRYATGDEVYFADLFLAPQIHAAFTRFNLDMTSWSKKPVPLPSGSLMSVFSQLFVQTQYPLLSRLHEAYNEIPAFVDARPDKQPDAPA